ncbi:hypothetical protein SAZ10_32730 [Mesorhizobium sp. BAC0120]|uniref:hypothetical protein n=1 Tax=Mesorhizobium sp. BAC0120 TaxID=3090670 RepID=UPI00298D1A92|nr:hypothetical protein [Mesorhizobium sp. BAC0120]MDW6026536.1 hypothetical protein [Mesorhizobium sp. BAC0120]
MPKDVRLCEDRFLQPKRLFATRIEVKILKKSELNFLKTQRSTSLIKNNSTTATAGQARFAERQKRAADRMQATAEYVSEAKVRAAKTARLREMRLANEEAQRTAEALKPVETKTKRVARSAKAKTVASSG